MSSVTASRASQANRNSKVELAKGQAQFTTSAKNAKTDLEAMKQQMENAKKLVVDTMIKTSQAQMINSGGGGSNSDTPTAMMNAVSTIAEFEMSQVNLEQSMKTNEMLQQSSFATMSQMVGQRVSINDNARNFSGSPVRFAYEITGKNIPPNALIQTQISIMSDEGKKIFSKTYNTDKVGKNGFVWDGKNDDGEVVENGTYKISVSAGYTTPGAKSNQKIGLTATTVKLGTVDSVEIDDDMQIALIVDGQRMCREAVTGITRDGKKDVEEATGPISDYLGYIGKNVEVEQNKINFTNSKVNVPFVSAVDAKDAKIEMRFFDEADRFVGYAESVQTIKAGQNNFAWNGWDVKTAHEFGLMKEQQVDVAYLPVGVYRYEVSSVIRDEDGQDKLTKLDNKGSYEIDSVDKVDGKIKITSGAYKFDVRDVKKVVEVVSETKVAHNQLIQEGANLIGKIASYEDDIMDYDGSAKVLKGIRIPGPLDADQALGDVNINIFGKDGVIKTIKITGADAYVEGSVPVPQNVGQLTDESKSKVKLWFQSQYPSSDYNDPNDRDDAAISNFIASEFREGRLFQAGYDPTAADADLQRLKNMGIMKVEWDGTNNAGAKLPSGEYKYEVQYSIIQNGTTSTLTLPRTTYGQVLDSRVEKDELILGLTGGVDIKSSKVTRIGIAIR